MSKRTKIIAFTIVMFILFNISSTVFAEVEIAGNEENTNSIEVTNDIEEKKIQNTNTRPKDPNNLDIGTLNEEQLDTENQDEEQLDTENTAPKRAKSRVAAYNLNTEGTVIEGKEYPTKTHVYRDGKNYTYTRVNGLNSIEIERYCFETGEYKQVFYNGNDFDVETVCSYKVKNKVIYTAFYSTRERNELRIVGYDTQTEIKSYDQTFPIEEKQFLGNFCIDNNHNIYFSLKGSTESEVTLVSYTKDGKFIDSYTREIFVNGRNAFDLLGTSKNDKILFCAEGVNIGGVPSWWNDCVLKIDNGKFLDDYIYVMRQYGGMIWRFLDESQTHAYDQYGEFYEIDYNADNEAGISYTIKDSIKLEKTTSVISTMTTSDDKYAYIGTGEGILYVYNWHTYEIEKYLTIGEGKAITGVYINGDKILLEYYKDRKYYALNVDLTDCTSAVKNEIISDHVALMHTKAQIKNKYDELAIVNKSVDLYENTPSTKAPYRAGSLLPQVKTDTVNQINYFRWVAGLSGVKQNDQYMDYSQKGAVILAANGVLAHKPTKPSDMDTEFYNLGYKATACKIGKSANVSKGTPIAYSIKGYVDDTSNMDDDVGHRLSMLDPQVTSTSFGYAERYGVVNMFKDGENDNNETYYSWPSPGNFPVESMNYYAKWSITLNNTNYYTAGDRYITIKADGKEYSSKDGGIKLYKDSYYPTYYFDIPKELQDYLRDGEYSIQHGKKVEVELNGIMDKYGNTYVIKYPINFFSLDKVLTGISLNSKTTVKVGTTQKLELAKQPVDAQPDENIIWKSENENIATINSDGTITAKSIGTTTITAEVDGLKATTTLNVVDYLLGDANGDGKVTAIDYTKVLAHVKKKKLLTDEEFKRADVNLDGKVTAIDYTKILAHVKGKVLLW